MSQQSQREGSWRRTSGGGRRRGNGASCPSTGPPCPSPQHRALLSADLLLSWSAHLAAEAPGWAVLAMALPRKEGSKRGLSFLARCRSEREPTPPSLDWTAMGPSPALGHAQAMQMCSGPEVLPRWAHVLTLPLCSGELGLWQSPSGPRPSGCFSSGARMLLVVPGPLEHLHSWAGEHTLGNGSPADGQW